MYLLAEKFQNNTTILVMMFEKIYHIPKTLTKVNIEAELMAIPTKATRKKITNCLLCSLDASSNVKYFCPKYPKKLTTVKDIVAETKYQICKYSTSA